MKGILFRQEMIKAIREGRKTQTRRLIRPQPFIRAGVMRWVNTKVDINIDDNADLAIPYARYQVGEVVYIKEAICKECYEKDNIEDACYKTDEDTLEPSEEIDCDSAKWRSPMMMPAWAARYFIQITGVKPQRLQEITEEDAIREGCQLIARTIQPFELKPKPHFTAPERPFTYRDHFIGLWDSINEKKYPWSSNNWVWVYAFKKVDRP